MDLPVRNRFLSAAETHVFGPRVVNELRFGFLDLRSKTENQDIVTASQLGIVRPSNNVTNGIYRFDLLGLGIGPNDSATSTKRSTPILGPTLSAIRSANTSFVSEDSTPIPVWIAISPRISTDWCISTASRPSCSAFRPTPLIPAEFPTTVSCSTIMRSYIQDDYKVTRSLTVNLGLRWDLISAPKDALHHMANVIPGCWRRARVRSSIPNQLTVCTFPG